MSPSGFDTLLLRNINFPFPISFGPDAWGRFGKPQPATLSLLLSYPRPLIELCGGSDDVSFTLSYGELYRKLEQVLRDATIGEDGRISSISLEELASTICSTALGLVWKTIPGGPVGAGWDMTGARSDISIQLPKAILSADNGLTYRVVKWFVKRTGSPAINQAAQPGIATMIRTCRIDAIHCNCIIGVNPHERETKQAVVVSLEFNDVNENLHLQVNILQPLQEIARRVTDVSPPNLLI